MLIPDVFAEVLHFFDRRYLTTLQLHGRGLRDIVDAACPKYPLARLALISISVLPPSRAVIGVVNADCERINSKPLAFFDAVRDVKILLQKSYVRRFELCEYSRQLQKRAPITNRQWSALVSAIRCATVESIALRQLDLTDVEAHLVKQILDASCLEEVALRRCRIRTASISDAFLTLCGDNGVTRLMINDNDFMDGPSLSVTEEAILDYCFRAERRPGTTVISLELSTVQVGNSFLRRLIKMMEDSQSGRPYVCDFVGLHALPAPDEFRQYEVHRSNIKVTFRIPLPHDSYDSHKLHYIAHPFDLFR